MIAYAKVFGGGDNIQTDNEIKIMQTGCIWLGTSVSVGVFWVHKDKNLFSVTHALLIA
jgi:hypothetical protein